MIDFYLCQLAAKQIVLAHSLPYEFLCIGGGRETSSGSTRFSREGTTVGEKSYSLPADLAALIQQSYTGSQVPAATSSAEQSLLQALLGQSTSVIPGLSQLQSIMGIDPQNFSGLSALTNMAARNPYSSDYESGVGALYDRSFSKGRALAQSGPGNVRGGTARQGFELGESDALQGMNKFREVRGQQDKEAGVVQQAVQTMNAIEGMRRGNVMQAQGQNMGGELGRKGSAMSAAGGVNDLRRANAGNVTLASEMLGKPKTTCIENLKGRGSQGASSAGMNGGITCCLIFLQALNGKLPTYVRQGRDEFQTRNRRSGYVWMSSWLVPLMRRSGLISSLVNFVMIKPFLVVGQYAYTGQCRVVGPALVPLCWAWFWLWSLIGVIYGKSLRPIHRTEG